MSQGKHPAIGSSSGRVMEVGGGVTLYVIHRENFENLPKCMKSPVVLDMKALLKLNCLILIVKRACGKLYIFQILKFLHFCTNRKFYPRNLAKVIKLYFKK
jgi:hypothetical protein